MYASMKCPSGRVYDQADLPEEFRLPDPNEPNWIAVSARAQAYQALHLAQLADKSLLERANFLMTLGLSRAEAAGLLGSTDDSLRVQMARAKKKAAGAAAGRTGGMEQDA
jgi:hypothetical protein